MRASCGLYQWRWWQLSLKTCVFATLLVRARSNGGGDPTGFGSPSTKREIVLVLDVDNTLYNEALLRRLSSSSIGIEEQIVQNIHSYCEKRMGISKEEADRLHREYGSTIEGLRHLWSNNKGAKASLRPLQEKMKDCYESIWPPSMDYSALLQLHQPSSNLFATGYSHGDDSASQLSLLRGLLESMPCPLYLASNSPSWHVQTVLQALGMLNVPWTGLATPDYPRGGIADGISSSNTRYTIYPTKHSPSLFYQDILHRNINARSSHAHVILVDDSQKNIDILPEQLMTGIHVSPYNPLPSALLQAVGVIAMPSSSGNSADSTSKYEFSQVKYLHSKNVVDAMSLHRPTWNQLAEELLSLLQRTPATDDDLQIVDLGAGLLSMFKLVLEGDDDNQLPSLIDQLLEGCIHPNALFRGVRYFAYEPNRELQSQCIQVLQDLGFTSEAVPDEKDHEYIFVGTRKGRPISVHLRAYDYNEDEHRKSTFNPEPHVIVGCCFADLIDPYKLVPSLLQKFLAAKGSTKKRPDSCLFYFPITFRGITQFVPPQLFDIRPGKAESLPSDTVAFALYSKALEQTHGHNLDPLRLVEAIKAFGGTLLSSGGADWDIDPKQHPYLWETLLYFFERVAGPELIKRGWNAAGWLQRARKPQSKHNSKLDSCPSILVSNVDLLFRLPRLGRAKLPFMKVGNDEAMETALDQQRLGIEEIVFTAPYKVSSIRKLEADLGPHQVLIKSEYSLISSGTELKVFKGLFDDAALDVNIKGMEEERMAYPLAYGYCLVGRVVQCGSKVDGADQLLGRLVFTFSAHATHVIADRDAIQLVPEGIAAEDAIFMPSIETALSLVHDAHLRVGEKVAVFGQGLIGLLVTSILSSTVRQEMILQAPCSGTKMGTVTTFDAIPSRLAVSAAMGASQALLPSEVEVSGPFDIAIEVSGNARALQSAIDNTSNHGRLVVGSWYGNADVTLKLGIDFHRSHKTIITSQVSEIKAELSGLWTKQRRFALTWELVRQIRPSRLITMQTSLSDAQKAYEALDQGAEIAVAFKYDKVL